MPKKGENISLTSYDDLFETDESRAGRQFHYGCREGNHERGEERRSGTSHLPERAAAKIFSAILHRAADAGHHHQTARSVAEKEIPRTRTINTIPQRALRIFWGVLLLSERAEFI